MANKKISQLTSATSVEAADLFPIAESVGGSYTTKKCTPADLAEFALNPIAATQVSGLNKNIYFDNNDANWSTASAVVTQNPYLQVRQSDGLLVTGSGIGNAVGGDNMGNGVATTDVTMQNKNITGVHSINFYGGENSLIEYNNTIGHMFDVKVQAAQDLTLSGYRHVNISGQALDLASTPISGNVTITGGNLEIDPANKLIVNEIEVIAGTAANDSGILTIHGASRHVPYDINSFYGVNENANVYWNESNIQFAQVDGSLTAPEYSFATITHGQTLTMYVEHTAAANAQTVIPAFVSGSESVPSNVVLWGGTGGPPILAANRTNVYTFAGYNGAIFASAITGYEY